MAPKEGKNHSPWDMNFLGAGLELCLPLPPQGLAQSLAHEVTSKC